MCVQKKEECGKCGREMTGGFQGTTREDGRVLRRKKDKEGKG